MRARRLSQIVFGLPLLLTPTFVLAMTQMMERPIKPIDLASVDENQPRPTLGPGIRELDEDLYSQAKAEAAQKWGSRQSYSLAASNMRKRLLGAMTLSFPFDVNIVTPYTRAVTEIAEARRKFEAQPAMRLADLNAAKVEIVVTPSGPLNSLDPIENVVLQRDGGGIIRPINSLVRPAVYQNGMGATRRISEGVFVFDVLSFAPNADLTIVFVGQSMNYEWKIRMDELSSWK
jgi:hypothetical protein